MNEKYIYIYIFFVGTLVFNLEELKFNIGGNSKRHIKRTSIVRVHSLIIFHSIVSLENFTLSTLYQSLVILLS